VLFRDNDTKLNTNDNNYDRLWEIREVYDILNAVCSKFYNPSEHLAPDQVIILKGRLHSSGISQRTTNV
jgi:hypothetical protein